MHFTELWAEVEGSTVCSVVEGTEPEVVAH